MSETAEQLKSAIAGLSSTDRADLAYFLLGTLDGIVETSVDEEWESAVVAAAQRRMDEVRNGTIAAEPIEDVIQAIQEKYA